MADLSRSHIKSRVSCPLEIRPYLRDHAWEGKIILPAVEIMILLARRVRSEFPQANLQLIESAQFNKMLVLDPAAESLEVQTETVAQEGRISAALLTSVTSRSGAVKRTLEHARLTFVQPGILPEPSPPLFPARQPADGCMSIPAVSVYRELVPFGAAFQNITGDLAVSEEGALADISGGSADADDAYLGSPFAFDAAMHAACVWGQRFCGVTALPVGFARRIIYRPTRMHAAYRARIIPVDVRCEPLLFNVWIFDAGGIISEQICGLKMRDVTGGRLKPPGWIREGACKKLS